MKKSILLVDDPAATLATLKRALDEAGYGVTRVAGVTAEEALKIFSDAPPEIVLVQLYQGGGSGVTIAEQVRQRPDGAIVPILFFGKGQEMVTSVSDALAVGGDYYFQHPLDTAKVVAKIQSYIGIGDEPAQNANDSEKTNPAFATPRFVSVNKTSEERLEELDFFPETEPAGSTPLDGSLPVGDPDTATVQNDGPADDLDEDEAERQLVEEQVQMQAEAEQRLAKEKAPPLSPQRPPAAPARAPAAEAAEAELRRRQAELEEQVENERRTRERLEREREEAAKKRALEEAAQREQMQIEQQKRDRLEAERLKRVEAETRAKVEAELKAERAREEAEAKAQRAREEAERRAADEIRRRQEDEDKKKAEELRRRAEDEARRRIELEVRAKQDAEARAKLEAERSRLAEEAKQKELELQRLTEEAIERDRREEDARQREDETRRKEEEARRRAEDEARRRAEDEARRRAEEELRKRTDEDEARRVEDERQRTRSSEDEIKKRVEAEVRKRIENEMRNEMRANLAPLTPSTPADVPLAVKPPPNLAGALDSEDIAQVLAGFVLGQITGRVRFNRTGIDKTIGFEKGRPVEVVSNDPQDRLEEFLYRERLLTRSQYQSCRLKQLPNPRQMGAAVVADGYLKPPELFEVVRQHFEQTLQSLFDWDSGSYAFEPILVAPEDRIVLPQPPERSITLGIKRRYPLERLVRRLGGPTSLLVAKKNVDTSLDRIGLEPKERALVQLLDGAHSIEDVVFTSGLTEERVYQALASLVVFELAEVVVRGIDGQDSADKERGGAINRARIKDQYDLAKRADYFEFLGLEANATEFEIERALRSLRRAFAKERFGHDIGTELDVELKEIDRVLADAEYVLSDARLRDAYIQHMQRPAGAKV